MSNEAETQKQSQNSNTSNDTTATVTFDGKEYTIKRLKAGAFYRALKVYMEMIQDVVPKNATSKTKEEDMDFDFEKLVKSMLETWPEKKTELLAICCTGATKKTDNGVEDVVIDKNFILENAYSEEIDTGFETGIRLNNFSSALKNSAAPIVGLQGLGLTTKESK